MCLCTVMAQAQPSHPSTGCYWEWMNGNISKEGITKDLEYMKAAGIESAFIFDAWVGVQRGPVDYGSPEWVECVALDGGMKEGEHETQVVLVHRRESDRMQNFTPGIYKDELDGKAFRGPLGEFVFTAVQTEEVVGKDDLMLDTLLLVCARPEVKRLMLVVPEPMMGNIRQALRRQDNDERRTTVFTMQPTQGGTFRQELLGFSLLAALGISSKEIDEKITQQ